MSSFPFAGTIYYGYMMFYLATPVNFMFSLHTGSQVQGLRKRLGVVVMGGGGELCLSILLKARLTYPPPKKKKKKYI